MRRFQQFLVELRRRRVYRVAVAYAVVGLGVLEGTDVLVPALSLPPGLVTWTAVIALAGFPVALGLAWRYQITPDPVDTGRAAGSEVPVGPTLPMLAAVAGLAFVAFAVGWALRPVSRGLGPGREAPVSIAVLPFTNLSGPDDAYFTDGLQEEIIGRLSNVPSFRVTSRTSVMGYRRSPQPVRRIAADLGVEAVLEGSVRRAGNTLRMTAQLVDAARDEHLWSGSYDREYSLEAILDIQSDVAREVASALRVALDLPPGPPASTADIAAYDLYLLGRYHWNRRTAADLRRAVTLFERALERDPGFGKAWAGLGEVYAVLAAYDDSADPYETMPRAREAATQALERDSTLAEAHATLGFVAFTFDWDPRSTEAHFRRALRHNQSHAPTLYWLGWYLGLVGRAEEGRRMLDRSVALAPLSVAALFSAGSAYMLNGAFEAARETLRRATELDPSFFPAWADLGSTEYLDGRPAAAAEAWSRQIAAMGRSVDVGGLLATLPDARPSAVDELRGLLPPGSLTTGEALMTVGLFAVMGDSATVPSLIARVHAARLPGLPRLYQLPYLTPYLDHPEIADVSREFRSRFGLEP